MNNKLSTPIVFNDQLINALHKVFIGHDHFFDLPKNDNFPKFEIIRNKKTEDLILKVLLVGYQKEDINVSLNNNRLSIEHTKKDEITNDDLEYLTEKVIAQRSFKLGFNIAPNLEIKDAEFKEGILIITFKKNVTEQRLIEIK